ncbi:MAG TPA: EF-P lysine aminoacylase EpmA [Polyangia bacterium]|jgi:lysyl-tRNA synthetase class 2|nr:EF-P lysine aminoacylase EpmA [Polyangia bacterium]
MADERARLAGRRGALEARSRIVRAARAWFEQEGFLEVETPARVRAPGQEIHLDAIASGSGSGPDGDARWLVTSPEYHMKRLLGAGFERIAQIGKAWRAGEVGPHHQPEFLIAEWYRAGAPLTAIADDCEALVHVAARAAGATNAALDLSGPFERTTVGEVVKLHAGVTLVGDESVDALAGKARAAGIDVTGRATWDDVFFQIWLDRVEPQLGRGRPTFVFDWPAPLGALARRKTDDPRLVERFELYANGLELANAFGELTDADEQRARFLDESATRGRLGKTVYALDERLLAALPHMRPTSGVALGMDRLIMLVLGAADIRDVVAFADDEV